MSRFSGVDLTVGIGDGATVTTGTLILGVTSVSDEHSFAKTDVTGSDTANDFRVFVGNLKTGTVSIAGHVDTGAGNFSRLGWVGQTWGTTITAGSGGPTLTGTIFIDGIDTDADLEGAVDFSINATWTAKPVFVE